ncbi:SOS response-associated peptidase family protein [Brevibacillus porteri]|uniref:SOS response-associated peptidase family protein n=1 Tax=Brevibacillus porteri TaxID=2126350 RepID=UPI00370C9CA9
MKRAHYTPNLPYFHSAIAPGQLIPAIISGPGKRRIGQLKWGLVPSWAQDEKSGYP